MKKLLAVAALACLPVMANAGFIILDDTAPRPQRAADTQIMRVESEQDAGGSDIDEASLSPHERRLLARKRAAQDKKVEEPSRMTAVTGKGVIRVGGLKKISGAARNTAIIHKGKKPRRIGSSVSVSGAAPLNKALGKIVPAEFAVYAAEGVDLDANMALMSGRNWVDSLNATLLRSRYSAAIDWGTSDVVIAVDEDADRIVVGQAKKKMPKKDIRVWAVRSDDGLLSGVIDRWCKESKKECKKVSWTSSHDLPIEAEASFSGTFAEAMASIMASVAESSGHQFNYVIHPNGVLSVLDGNGAQK